MPKEPQKAELPDGKYNIVLTIPGWLKNQILEHCATIESSINDWATSRLLLALREDKGLPPVPEATNPIPTTADQIRAWATGQKLLQPCGQTDCQPEWQQLQNMKFCSKCGIRGT